MLIDAVFPAASELGDGLRRRARRRGLRRPATSALRLELEPGFAGVPRRSRSPGTIGYLLGSIVGWAIGLRGGRPLLERHGRWLHLYAAKLDRAERWFERWEDWAVFLGRLTPVVRSFVSIPAGRLRVPLRRYTVLTLIGSAIWCFALAGAGWALGSELGGLPPRLPLRRLRDRRRDRGRGCVVCLEVAASARSRQTSLTPRA